MSHRRALYKDWKLTFCSASWGPSSPGIHPGTSLEQVMASGQLINLFVFPVEIREKEQGKVVYPGSHLKILEVENDWRTVCLLQAVGECSWADILWTCREKCIGIFYEKSIE